MIVKHSINLSNSCSDFFLVDKEDDELENLTFGHFCGDLIWMMTGIIMEKHKKSTK